VPDNYRLSPGEPSGIAAVSRVLAAAHAMAGGLPVSTLVELSEVKRDTVVTLLEWHGVAGADPEAAYERGLALDADVHDSRLRRVSRRLRRPRFETLVKVAAAMGCEHPTRVAELAVSKAPGVVLDVPESVR
jgi:hypothetical protein